MKKSQQAKGNTLGDWAYLAIEKHLDKIIKQEADVIKDRDPEAVHQMRVGMRRLRSAVTGFAPALDLPKDASERKIAKIARLLGQLRDLDVLKEAIKTHYQPTLPQAEQKSLAKVLDYLAKERKHAIEAIKSNKSQEDYEEVKDAFEKWLKKPTFTKLASLPINDVLPELLLPAVSKLFLHPGWLVGVSAKNGEISFTNTLTLGELGELLAEQGLMLHSLRKEAKRVRYQMELFTEFYGSNYADSLEDITEIQSILGKIQDCAILAEFMADVFKSDIQNYLPTLAQQLAQTSYDAWQEWRPFQEKYLYGKARQRVHLALIKPSGEPPRTTKDNDKNLVIG